MRLQMVRVELFERWVGDPFHEGHKDETCLGAIKTRLGEVKIEVDGGSFLLPLPQHISLPKPKIQTLKALTLFPCASTLWPTFQTPFPLALACLFNSLAWCNFIYSFYSAPLKLHLSNFNPYQNIYLIMCLIAFDT